MTTGHPNIPNFDFEVLFNLNAQYPEVILTNVSSGTLIDCDFAFELHGPSGPIYLGNTASPDQSGPWSQFTIPENVGNPNFEFGIYKITGIVKLPTGEEKTYTRSISLPITENHKPGENCNYGVGQIDYLVKCQEGKIFARDITSYYYKGVAGEMISRKLTIEYPQDSTGYAPTPVDVNGYPAANFNIPFNAEGYELLLSSVFEYDLGQNIYIQIPYYQRRIFAVTCNIDLCAIKCEIDKFAEDVNCNPTPAKYEKLTKLNTQLNLLILSQMQPECGNASDIVANILKIGKFSCSCYKVGASAGIGTTPNNCDAVYTCLDELLAQVDPGCVVARKAWSEGTPLQKIQYIIDKICSCCNGGGSNCAPAINLTFDPATKKLHWDTMGGAPNWGVSYQVVTPPEPATLFTAEQPVNTGANHWEVDMSSVDFQLNTIYRFTVIAYCNDGSQSNPTTIEVVANSSCTTAVINSVSIQ